MFLLKGPSKPVKSISVVEKSVFEKRNYTYWGSAINGMKAEIVCGCVVGKHIDDEVRVCRGVRFVSKMNQSF